MSKYDKSISLALDDEIIEKIDNQKVKEFFFPYQKDVKRQDIIRAMILYSNAQIISLNNK